MSQTADRGRRGTYGVDAPLTPIVFVGCSVVAFVFVVLGAVTGSGVGSVVGPLVPTVIFAVAAFFYLHATRRGKFEVWEELLDRAAIEPDARVLDLGCGRGAVLLAAAKRLGDGGSATGIDLWRSVDQSGNSEDVTRHNAELEGVSDRVRLDTGDLRDLPYDDASFDVVVSSLALHNIKPAADRDRAAEQALRVLRPGGRMIIVDLPAGKGYLRLLEQRLDDARLRPVGWRMWWGGPFYPSSVLTGTRRSS